MILPAAFENKMKSLLGDEYESYIACYKQPRYYGLRVNTSKISVEDFLKISPFSLTPIPWIENGFYYDGEQVSPGKHPYYFAGLYYLQEPSAMTPANRLPIQPGDKVLDLCAAPGGKATELGAKLRGKGVLVANDISSSRAKGLLKNIEVFGISNALVLSEEPGKLTDYFPEYFDKILIDAPCSGEGMFRKDKKMVAAWEEHGPDFFSKLQQSIIMQAAKMLKPGGMLLYSTCTFDGLENEGTIEYLIQKHPDFQICQIAPYEGFVDGIPELTKSNDVAYKKTVRIFPHKMQGEGHFLALLKKESTDNTTVSTYLKKEKNKKIPQELKDFFLQISWNMDWNRLELYGDRAFYMPPDVPDMKGIRFLRTGLYLGDVKKKRFEPSQSLAMAMKKEDFTQTLDLKLEDERVIRYLKGETLELSESEAKMNGWYLICVDGYPLGFGKVNHGILKNKYLAGWRWQS